MGVPRGLFLLYVLVLLLCICIHPLSQLIHTIISEELTEYSKMIALLDAGRQI